MKKLTKRIWAVALAVVMVLAMTVTAMAAGTGTITITPPTGTDANAKTTYNVYKVFDANGDGNGNGNGANISYKLAKGTSLTGEMATYFDVDTAGNVTAKDGAKDAEGNLTQGAIEAIEAYVNGDTAVATVSADGTSPVTTEPLSNGYYYVTTTTGTAVSVTSTNPTAEVNDKNVAPTVDKKITGASSTDEDGKKALAELGSTVTYTATVTLGNGTKNVKFHDKMGTGLTLDLAVNNRPTVLGIDAANYTIQPNPDKGDTLTVSFTDGTTGTAMITYSATVNSDALTVDTGKDTATVSYDYNGATTTSTPSETHVYNAKFTVTVMDGYNQPLAGAGFVIKNADGKYYKKDGNDVKWVENINEATEMTTTEMTTTENSNVIVFTGLANGTYTLEEKTVPAGYNKAADSTFTVAEHDYDTMNLEQSKTVVNNAGTVLPSTGGIGTTMFYVIGAILVLGAGVLLVTRKRMSAK